MLRSSLNPFSNRAVFKQRRRSQHSRSDRCLNPFSNRAVFKQVNDCRHCKTRVLIPFQTGRCSNLQTVGAAKAPYVLIPFQTGRCSNAPISAQQAQVEVLIPFQTGRCSNQPPGSIIHGGVSLNPFSNRAVFKRLSFAEELAKKRLNPFSNRAVFKPRRSSETLWFQQFAVYEF